MAAKSRSLSQEEITLIETPRGQLFGILHVPDGLSADSPAIIMLSAGQLSRVGPQRLYVKAARLWAEKGIPVLRLDMSGIGDSLAENTEIHFDNHSPLEVACAIDHVRERLGSRKILLHGLCAGARAAIKTAAASTNVNGVIAWSCPIYSSDEASPKSPYEDDRAMSKFSAQANISQALSSITELRVLTPAWWKNRWQRGTRDVSILLRSIVQRLRGGSTTDNPFLIASDQLIGQDKPILFVYGDRDRLPLGEFKERYESFPEHHSPAQGFSVISQATHTFSGEIAQRQVIEVTDAWIRNILDSGKEAKILPARREKSAQSSRLRINVLSSLESIGEEAWNDLCQRSADATVFQSYGWITAWWETFKRSAATPWLLCVYDGDRLVGLAPMFISRRKSRRRPMVRFMGDGMSDYQTFIYDDDYDDLPARMLDETLDFGRRRYTVALSDVPEESALGRQISADRRRVSLNRYRPVSRVACPRVATNGDTMKFDQLSDKKSLKRHARLLARLGEVTVEHLLDETEIMASLDEFFDQHVRRWSITEYPSLFLDRRQRKFFREITKNLSRANAVVLTRLLLNGNAVATHYGLISGESFIWYKPSFDLRYWKSGPGEVLLKELLHYCKAQQIQIFDFTQGNEPFKSRFANETHFNSSYIVHPNAAVATACRILDAAKARMKSLAFLIGPYRSLKRTWRAISTGDTTARTALSSLLYQRKSIRAYSLDSGAATTTDLEDLKLREIDVSDLIATSESPACPAELKSNYSMAFRAINKGQRCILLMQNDHFAGWFWYGDPANSQDPDEVALAESWGIDRSVYGLHIWRNVDELSKSGDLGLAIANFLHSDEPSTETVLVTDSFVDNRQIFSRLPTPPALSGHAVRTRILFWTVVRMKQALQHPDP